MECLALSPPISPGDVRSSSLSPGRCFVYVWPCAYEDLVKLGFSRDPIGRLQALHRRYFEFFDLDRAFLIETETVRDARRLELLLAQGVALHNAPAPLVVRAEAAGHTEWYRGASSQLSHAASDLGAAGFTLHMPAREWLRQSLIQRGDQLFSWSRDIFGAIEWERLTGEPASQTQWILCDTLDAYEAFNIDLEPFVPPAVWRWHCDRQNLVANSNAQSSLNR